MGFRAVAIEREYASGGREVGEKLAKRMGVQCFGHEILEKAAERLNLPVHRLEDADENVPNTFFYGMAAFPNLYQWNMAENSLLIEQKLAMAEEEIICNLALESCVLVGRRSAAILADNDNILKVFIDADMEARKERAVKLYGIIPKKVCSVLRRMDKRRENYFKTTMGIEWKDAYAYHLFLNSGLLGVNRAVDMIYSAVNPAP